jgi:hypothetical protein
LVESVLPLVFVLVPAPVPVPVPASPPEEEEGPLSSVDAPFSEPAHSGDVSEHPVGAVLFFVVELEKPLAGTVPSCERVRPPPSGALEHATTRPRAKQAARRSMRDLPQSSSAAVVPKRRAKPIAAFCRVDRSLVVRPK